MVAIWFIEVWNYSPELCKDKNQYDKNIMYAHYGIQDAWLRMILEICYEIVLQTMKKKILSLCNHNVFIYV